MLITVLVITAVGLLFGAGALLLFRFQCQLRIDRQHELEKVYAVRSALNYLRTYTGQISDDGRAFGYHTGSGRDLKLIVKPVNTIFPDLNNSRHFAMQRSGDFQFPCQEQYNVARDYEYGMENWTNLSIVANSPYYGGGSVYGLGFDDVTATNSVKWWVNIGMRDTGGWLQEDYGRRYCFWPGEYVNGSTIKDVMRLCIIRNVTNEANPVGRRHGWPLSQPGEMAIVFEISPRGGGGITNNADMTVYEYKYDAIPTELLRWPNCPSYCNMGIQLADDKVSVFYIGNEELNKTNQNSTVYADASSRGYIFFDRSAQLTDAAYRYFAEDVVVGGVPYGGIYTNGEGKVQAPELRAVFEVEASSDNRPMMESNINQNLDFLTDFRVSPAYQYDVLLEHPATVTNRATVAQKIGKYKRGGKSASGALSLTNRILTYDTHGTEHKGFRRDERDFERNNGQ